MQSAVAKLWVPRVASSLFGRSNFSDNFSTKKNIALKKVSCNNFFQNFFGVQNKVPKPFLSGFIQAITAS
ncbi:MAG: hypothetical protein D6687_04970 [Acidobacteria bacterium]|nr:MAG: hypothetical protein D6687_04970 [Acidobacteriota bacterium]